MVVEISVNIENEIRKKILKKQTEKKGNKKDLHFEERELQSLKEVEIETECSKRKFSVPVSSLCDRVLLQIDHSIPLRSNFYL